MEKRKWANSNALAYETADSEAAKALQADLWLPADVAGETGNPL